MKRYVITIQDERFHTSIEVVGPFDNEELAYSWLKNHGWQHATFRAFRHPSEDGLAFVRELTGPE